MDDYFPILNLPKWKSRLRGIKGTKKINILILLILILCMRLFFYTFLKKDALAQKPIYPNEINWEAIEPLAKIGQNIIGKKNRSKNYCSYAEKNYLDRETRTREKKYQKLLKGYPLEAMAPAVACQDKKVAAFLISIAKKESNWGLHAPKKEGRDCFNYWGYRGSYNQTASGYSCFDNPEQAVLVVGNRIERLISQKIDTPQKMVIWKCGYSCAGFKKKKVKKWISDVSLYYNKLNT